MSTLERPAVLLLTDTADPGVRQRLALAVIAEWTKIQDEQTHPPDADRPRRRKPRAENTARAARPEADGLAAVIELFSKKRT
jgi:hypothetical protein